MPLVKITLHSTVGTHQKAIELPFLPREGDGLSLSEDDNILGRASSPWFNLYDGTVEVSMDLEEEVHEELLREHLEKQGWSSVG